MYLYELFENSENCDLKRTEETITVKEIPTSGFSPEADECNIKLDCQYEEDFFLNSRGTKWWEGSEDLPLFYITNKAISVE
jgi:hypothetical protein